MVSSRAWPEFLAFYNIKGFCLPSRSSGIRIYYDKWFGARLQVSECRTQQLSRSQLGGRILHPYPAARFAIADKAVQEQLETAEVDSVLSKQEPLSRLTEEAHILLGE